ncbi:MAG: zf-HC2 domain-containing protein [Candidatus Latescibacterota bacterium]
MNCREFEDMIPEYLEGILDAETERLLTEHRLSCRDCACAVKIHEIVFSALNTAVQIKAPAGLTEKILALAEEDTVPARGNVFPKYLSLAAAFVFAALGFFNLIVYILENPGVRTASDRLISVWNSIPDWPAIMQGWMVSAQTAAESSRGMYDILFTPVQIPYISFCVPSYFLIAYAVTLICLTLSAWVYFRDTLSV